VNIHQHLFLVTLKLLTAINLFMTAHRRCIDLHTVYGSQYTFMGAV
jgi:hypothetical protein